MAVESVVGLGAKTEGICEGRGGGRFMRAANIYVVMKIVKKTLLNKKYHSELCSSQRIKP